MPIQEMPMQGSNKVVVFGASAGGIEALCKIVSTLPAHFPAPVLVVLHMFARRESHLPAVLCSQGPLRAHHPVDGEMLRAGIIYVAPPGHDLMIEGMLVRVKVSDDLNRFRPSIDALFQSAAHYFGPQSIAVILSGALDDGTIGIRSIKRAGGKAVVQADARFDSMPRNVLAEIEVDHVLPAAEIGPLITKLTQSIQAGERANQTKQAQAFEHRRTVFSELESALLSSWQVYRSLVTTSSESLEPVGASAEPTVEGQIFNLRLAEERIALLQRAYEDADMFDHPNTAVINEQIAALELHTCSLRRLIATSRLESVVYEARR